MVAVTATRAFGIGRAVFRYAERLVAHDAVLRVLADYGSPSTGGWSGSRPPGCAERGAATCCRGWSPTSTPCRTTCCAGCCRSARRCWSCAALGRLHRLAAARRPALILAAGLLPPGVGVPAADGRRGPADGARLAPARGELSTRVRRPAHRHRRADGGRRAARPVRRRRGARRPDADRASPPAPPPSTALGAGLTALVSGLTVTRRRVVGVAGGGRADGWTGWRWRSSC